VSRGRGARARAAKERARGGSAAAWQAGRGWERLRRASGKKERGEGRKKRKKRRGGEKKKKIGKRNKEKKKMGKREKKRKEKEGAVRASGDRGCGRPRVACGTREVGHAVGGERGKRRGEKEGRDSRRPITTRRV